MKGAYQSAGADTPADDRLRQYRALVRMRGHAPSRGPHLVRVLEMTDMVFQGRSREGVNSDTERGLVASRQGGRRQARHSLALRAPQQCSAGNQPGSLARSSWPGLDAFWYLPHTEKERAWERSGLGVTRWAGTPHRGATRHNERQPSLPSTPIGGGSSLSLGPLRQVLEVRHLTGRCEQERELAGTARAGKGGVAASWPASRRCQAC